MSQSWGQRCFFFPYLDHILYIASKITHLIGLTLPSDILEKIIMTFFVIISSLCFATPPQRDVSPLHVTQSPCSDENGRKIL